MSDPVRHYSSVREVLAEVAEFPRELVHHLLEDHGVDVLACNWEEGNMQGGSKRPEYCLKIENLTSSTSGSV